MVSSSSTCSESGDGRHSRDRVRKSKRRRRRMVEREKKAAAVSSSDCSSGGGGSDSECSSRSAGEGWSGGERAEKRQAGKRRSRDASSSSGSELDSLGRSRKRGRLSKSQVKEKVKEKPHKHKHKGHKRKEKSSKDSSGPVQLSKFLGRGKDDTVRRSVVSGKKIQMKVEKTKEDKLAESNRSELLKFLNASYD